ncbi:MAG: type II secretion system F family protein [Bacillota bacterium]
MGLQGIVVFAFLTWVTFLIGLHRFFSARKMFLAERLEQLAGRGTTEEAGREEHKTGLGKSLLKQAGRFSPRVFRLAADRWLTEADLPLRGEEFIALTFFCAAGGAVFAGVLAGRPAPVLPAGLIAGAIPWIVVRLAAKRRVIRFNGQLADTLLVMANSLRAGFSFLQAIEVVQREMPPPVSREFGRTFRELSLGTPVEEALTGLARRVKSDDLSLVVTAVLIQRQVGGNLAEVLEKISRTIQERVRIQGEIRTLTAQGRISGIIVGLLPVFLLVVMTAINPGYTGILFTTPVGRLMLACAALAQLLGWFLIRRITHIRV